MGGYCSWWSRQGIKSVACMRKAVLQQYSTIDYNKNHMQGHQGQVSRSCHPLPVPFASHTGKDSSRLSRGVMVRTSGLKPTSFAPKAQWIPASQQLRQGEASWQHLNRLRLRPANSISGVFCRDRAPCRYVRVRCFAGDMSPALPASCI